MDFEEELLGLTGGGAASSKRTKASKGSKSRRKRAKSDSEDGSASDMDLSQSDSDAQAPAASTSRGGSRRRGHKSAERVDTDEDESDEDEGRKGGAAKATDENPYPVEGIYKDTAERSRISKLPELEREDFIATRKEEINERVMRAEVAKLARASDARRGGAQDDDEGDDDDDDDEYGGARETRSRKVTGATKTKSEGLEKLKRSRAEKGKKRDKADSSDDDYEEPGRKKNRKASPSSSASSDMDVATSDEDDAPSSKAAAAAAKKKGKKAGPEPLGPSELRDITVPRAKLAEMCRASWFGEWLVGAFVRVTVGPNKDDPQRGNKYRVAQVTGLKKAKEPYRVEAVMTEHDLELTIGTDKARFPMASVSNGPLTDSEYAHYVRMCQTPKTAPPTSKEAAKIKAQLAKHTTYILTEEDLQKQLEASGANKRGPGAKTRMKIQRDHAVAAGDQAEVDRLNRELAALDAPTGAEQDRARMINERNRANNREEVRKAEAKAQDFRRKQAELLARGDTDVRVDPSARVKTMPRLNYDSSRPQTPGPGSGAATPTKGGPLAAANAAAANAETPRQRGSKIELASQVAINVDDLLDFWCISSPSSSLAHDTLLRVSAVVPPSYPHL